MNRGPYQIIIPCEIGDTIYEVNTRINNINHWYVYGIEKTEKDGWRVLVKNNKNKYKCNLTEFSFSDFGRTAFTTRQEAEVALEYILTPEQALILFKCGHMEEVTLTGTKESRQRYCNWLKQKVCRNCRNKESEKKGYPLVEMPYSEYKKNYKTCDTKVDSYNKEKGTIEVYVKDCN